MKDDAHVPASRNVLIDFAAYIAESLALLNRSGRLHSFSLLPQTSPATAARRQGQ